MSSIARLKVSRVNEPVLGKGLSFSVPATAEQTYAEKVLSYNPIAYWILGEAAGATAVDQINSPAQDGTYTGVTLGQPGIGDGNTAPLFDGANDFVNIYSAALDAAWSQAECSVMIWAKVFNAGVWTDGTQRDAYRLNVDGNNEIEFKKGSAPDDEMFGVISGGGNTVFPLEGGLVSTNWLNWVITISESANEVILYLNGGQEDLEVYAGTWAGSLDNTKTMIGAAAAAVRVWYGWLAHPAIFGRALSQPSIADLAVV